MRAFQSPTRDLHPWPLRPFGVPTQHNHNIYHQSPFPNPNRRCWHFSRLPHRHYDYRPHPSPMPQTHHHGKVLLPLPTGHVDGDLRLRGQMLSQPNSHGDQVSKFQLPKRLRGRMPDNGGNDEDSHEELLGVFRGGVGGRGSRRMDWWIRSKSKGEFCTERAGEGKIEKYIEGWKGSMETGAWNTFMHGIVRLNQFAKTENPQYPPCLFYVSNSWKNKLFYKLCTSISLRYNFFIYASYELVSQQTLHPVLVSDRQFQLETCSWILGTRTIFLKNICGNFSEISEIKLFEAQRWIISQSRKTFDACSK